jgi:hypothetical protein
VRLEVFETALFSGYALRENQEIGEDCQVSYDIPMRGKVRPWSASSFGFRAFIANFDSPHIGSSSSYHLNDHGSKHP